MVAFSQYNQEMSPSDALDLESLLSQIDLSCGRC